MIKEMLEDFVSKGGVIFTHSGRYANTNNNCFVFDKNDVTVGIKVDMYTPKSAGIKNEDGENLWQLLNKDNMFYRIYNGEFGEELQSLLKSCCTTKTDVTTLPQVYFKNNNGYDLLVPIGNAHNLINGTEYLWENKYYKSFTQKLGGSNPQNATHACNKMRGGFKQFNCTPPTVEDNYNA